MVGNLFLADGEGFLLRRLILLVVEDVLFRRNADDLLERRGQLRVVNFAHFCDDLTELNAPRRLNNHKITRRGPERTGREKIQLSRVLKSNANYVDHLLFSSIRLSSSRSTTACHVT